MLFNIRVITELYKLNILFLCNFSIVSIIVCELTFTSNRFITISLKMAPKKIIRKQRIL